LANSSFSFFVVRTRVISSRGPSSSWAKAAAAIAGCMFFMVLLLGVAGFEDGLSGRGTAVAEWIVPVCNFLGNEKPQGLLRL
jgi:hypothetical protein